jgi:hypothetical protein
MVDLLAMWGVSQAAGVIVTSIMQDLAKDGAKDYAKQFFKNSLTNVLHLPEKDALKEAHGKAIKAFLETFAYQLEMVDLPDNSVESYKDPLKVFIEDETVSSILGHAFVIDCLILETSTLAQTWRNLDLPSLPPQFNWEKLGKFYLQKVKEIIHTSEKLKAIFLIEAARQTSENIQEITGIKTEFDLDRYAKGLKNEYGHLTSSFLLAVAALGNSGQQDVSERDEEILCNEIDPIYGWNLKPSERA